MTSHYALTIGKFTDDDPSSGSTGRHHYNRTVRNNSRVQMAMERIHKRPVEDDTRPIKMQSSVQPPPALEEDDLHNADDLNAEAIQESTSTGSTVGPNHGSKLYPLRKPTGKEYYKNMTDYTPELLEPTYSRQPSQQQQQQQTQQPYADPSALVLTKLRHITQLLEEQKRERTHHVTEEMALYSFLGVFIIFVVDSFSKVSRYSRV
jgi:hypothetical protein